MMSDYFAFCANIKSNSGVTAARGSDMHPGRRLLFGVVLGLALAFPVFGLEKFTNEAQAQQHCPSDTVVWLNVPTMIWHYKSERWYARTKNFTFVCEREAAAASGGRGTRNGH